MATNYPIFGKPQSENDITCRLTTFLNTLKNEDAATLIRICNDLFSRPGEHSYVKIESIEHHQHQRLIIPDIEIVSEGIKTIIEVKFWSQHKKAQLESYACDRLIFLAPYEVSFQQRESSANILGGLMSLMSSED